LDGKPLGNHNTDIEKVKTETQWKRAKVMIYNGLAIPTKFGI
jgi:hypothetical protein